MGAERGCPDETAGFIPASRGTTCSFGFDSSSRLEARGRRGLGVVLLAGFFSLLAARLTSHWVPGVSDGTLEAFALVGSVVVLGVDDLWASRNGFNGGSDIDPAIAMVPSDLPQPRLRHRRPTRPRRFRARSDEARALGRVKISRRPLEHGEASGRAMARAPTEPGHASTTRSRPRTTSTGAARGPKVHVTSCALPRTRRRPPCSPSRWQNEHRLTRFATSCPPPCER